MPYPEHPIIMANRAMHDVFDRCAYFMDKNHPVGIDPPSPLIGGRSNPSMNRVSVWFQFPKLISRKTKFR